MRFISSLRWLGTAVSTVVLAWACNAPPTSLDATRTDVNGTNKESGGAASGSTAAGGDSTAGLPCAVSDVLSKRCRTCHDTEPKSGASTSLVTYGDLQKDFNGKKVYDLVESKIHATAGVMPPAAKLSDAEIAAIDGWVRGGAKQSSEQCSTAAPPPATQPFVCDAPAKVTTLKAGTPFNWTDASDTDQYVCFGVDETASGKKHAIALGPMVQNLDIVHHILVFQAPDSMPNTPATCSAATSTSWKLVTGWAPGGGNFEMPPEAGYPIEGTTHWVVQIHYNNARALQGQSDNSGFQLCETDRLRPNDAGVLAFGAMNFTIPPRTSSFTMQCDYTLGDRYKGVTFFAGKPHMHKLGHSISTQRLPGGSGTAETVLDQDPFQFEDQESHKMNIKVNPGDVMRTRCNWANPTDNEVSFGENTADEMCFNFLTYYPAIPDESVLGVPTQTWITPSLSVPLLGGPDCSQQ